MVSKDSQRVLYPRDGSPCTGSHYKYRNVACISRGLYAYKPVLETGLYTRQAYTQDRLIWHVPFRDKACMHPTQSPPAPLISHNHHIQVQKALSGTVSCTNRAYARDTLRGLRVLCTSPAYARDRLVRDRRLQNSGFYTRQACAQVRLMHATLRYYPGLDQIQ